MTFAQRTSSLKASIILLGLTLSLLERIDFALLSLVADLIWILAKTFTGSLLKIKIFVQGKKIMDFFGKLSGNQVRKIEVPTNEAKLLTS